ncbi:branched-chain amino acid aminotransferase [Aquimarina sp. AD1]|uniref:branched-chain amino acid aminotransferase n=1 Tax=unclassified Aquimarina TaxID=2627091 RepID=UPI000E4A48D5|nr:branched-chain amino acid aminotransferase [Aquimarina sp. AD1]AXT56661.1 branched-chain amino acid aminotransferase [Aquimarina sp. AD1]RKN25648.1 branched-chain amino acid aminotransferase [Aquimarina sp. AD1]
MEQQIKITKTANSKLKDIDFDNIPLGTTFTDHMFICEYENGAWNNPRIEPLELIPTHPAAMALHYGQAIFEGMKATVGKENTPLLFRPEENAKRFNHSAARLGMPLVPVDLFVEAVKQIVGVEHSWIPPKDGSALYLRPFMYADEPFIGMRAATSYKFIVICSPAGPFFTKKIRLYAETEYIRAADGGTGEAKAAGNYAAAILPTEKAKAKGYDQVLWLDANEHKYIQEVGTMNIFFKIGGKFITPSTDGSILKGITRDSVITLLKDKGFEVEERPITIDELITCANEGQLEEAFGTGTAVAIAMIEAIGYKDEVLTLSDNNPVSQDVKNTLDNIKTQKMEDTFNWIIPVSITEKVG